MLGSFGHDRRVEIAGHRLKLKRATVAASLDRALFAEKVVHLRRCDCSLLVLVSRREVSLVSVHLGVLCLGDRALLFACVG